jgi:hypothetical protein
MEGRPKVRQGQKLDLIQVTGTAAIGGYVNLDVFFQTKDGPVSMSVEAHIVKNMTTPLILGNDFADQYDISILRQEGRTRLLLGSSKREVTVDSSTCSLFTTKDGHTFRIRVLTAISSSCYKIKLHCRNRRIRSQRQRRRNDKFLRAFETTTIPAESIRKVRLSTTNLEGMKECYAEKLISFHHDVQDCYGPPDSLVAADNPYLHVSNFSKRALNIHAGQALAIRRSPTVWPGYKKSMNPFRKLALERQASFLHSVAKGLSSNLPQSSDEVPHNEGDEPLEGGPKTSEPAPTNEEDQDPIAEVDISNLVTKE